ncbi:MAG: hypothetical protein CL923_02675 [Deltaproteobacteria bacterium]|nr:hypothetical protein [Deltaproteobacteria bacterium]
MLRAWIQNRTQELALHGAIDPAHPSLPEGAVHSNRRRANARLHNLLLGDKRTPATTGCTNLHIVQTESRLDGQSSPETSPLPGIRETSSSAQPLAAPEIRVPILLLPQLNRRESAGLRTHDWPLVFNSWSLTHLHVVG